MPFTVASIGGIYKDSLYGTFGGNFVSLELPNYNVVNSSIAAGGWAAAAIDTAQYRFFLTETDYATFGRMSIFDGAGNLQDTITTGISPEALAIDYSSMVSTNPILSNEVYITAYPNPTVDELHIDISRLNQPITGIDLISSNGSALLSTQKAAAAPMLNLSTLPAGIYYLRVRTAKGDYIKPILKK